MERPCFLVLDREQAGGVSTRKLVLESSKVNVITAYSGPELLATLRRFPAIDGVILDGLAAGAELRELIRDCNGLSPGCPVIVVGGGVRDAEAAQHYLDTFVPTELLRVLEQLRPTAMRDLQQREDRLQRADCDA
jgi:DNA-binding NtrC family response regulator